MSVYEVIFSAANSCISHQLRYVNAVRRIPWYVTVTVTVQVRKVHAHSKCIETCVYVFFTVHKEDYGGIPPRGKQELFVTKSLIFLLFGLYKITAVTVLVLACY